MTDPLSLRAMAERAIEYSSIPLMQEKLGRGEYNLLKQLADAILALLAAQFSWANEKAKMERQLDQVLATAQVSYAEAFEMLAALRHASLSLAAKGE